MNQNSKRIAKNTIFLYFRMIILMGVTLYTSRVVLDKLGVEDYGLFNVVSGVVGMLLFINGSLSTGTSRFLAYEIGKGDNNRLRNTFTTAFYTHLLLAIIIAIVLETIGLWFVYHKLIIPESRLSAAVYSYHLSIIVMIISLTQVPYMSLIQAREKMGIYAYVSILEGVLKLVVAYLLSISEIDRLIIYSSLLLIVQILIAFIYRIYCSRLFKESRLQLAFNRNVFKSLLSFSGWNVIANFSETVKLQGYLVLINMFFLPVVASAQAIANQVAGALMQFVNNFRTAINPQIIKTYAAEDYETSKKLTIDSTILSFDLVLLIGLPIILLMEPIMKFWLVDVPPYAVVFTQLIIIQRIVGVFENCFYTSLMAAGKLKKNAFYSLLMGPGPFVVLYGLFSLGVDVMWMQYIGIITMSIFSFVIMPMLLVNEIEGYRYKDFAPCFINCAKVGLSSAGISYLMLHLLRTETVMSSIILFVLSVCVVAIMSYVYLDKSMKKSVDQALKNIYANYVLKK